MDVYLVPCTTPEVPKPSCDDDEISEGAERSAVECGCVFFSLPWASNQPTNKNNYRFESTTENKEDDDDDDDVRVVSAF